MKLEEQVVSLEVAPILNEKLSGIGVELEYRIGDWCYENTYTGRLMLITHVRKDSVDIIFPYMKALTQTPLINTDLKMKKGIVKAHTLTEMLSILPDHIYKEITTGEIVRHCRTVYSLNVDVHKKVVGYGHGGLNVHPIYEDIFFEFNDKINPATAAAQLYIRLVNNGYIKKAEKEC